MLAAIHQLHYLPWLRYFHKIASCDVFVVLDDVQFNKNGWQNRNKIKNAQGWAYLTIPVIQKFQQRLSEVMINNNVRWRQVHWNSLATNYSRSKYFKKYQAFLSNVYNKDWSYLNDLNYEMLKFFIEVLGIKTKIKRSSELQIEGEGSLRLVHICKAVGADTYLSGAYAARTYLETEVFEKAEIKITYQQWRCPVYRQRFEHLDFIPDLAIVDLLFNEGEGSLDILLSNSGRKII